ncbi:MAG: O-antigen ligase family protein [Crocinitomicaceae bacterium]|nr:O-antigen ligase family protein [Crocinitomicaceae bacterium]
MIIAYKQHSQFIMILAVMYVSGVWGGPVIYPMFPMFMLLFGIRKRYFELLITALWLLMLADYVPVKNATYDDLQFAKDLKFMVPLFLAGFLLMYREDFKPFPKLLLWFIPFFIVVAIGLQYSINFSVGLEKTISYFLMMLTVPFYVSHLHRDQGEYFWTAFFTFIIGMLTIGIVLRFAAPQIAMLDGKRFKSILGNPNGLGIFLNLTFMLWVILRELKLANFTKKENWYIILVIFISLIWSGSRNGMMSIFLFYLISRVIKIHWFLAVITVVIVLTFNEQIFEGFVGVIEFLGLQDYFRIESIEEGSGRKIAWVFAWQEIQNYYFVGGGFGQDEQVMRPNYYWLSKLGHQGGVHNSYLSMWFDAGIAGIIAFFGAFYGIVFKSMKYNYLVLAFAINIMFNITYESWLVASLNPFTILFFTILTIFSGNLRDALVTENNEQTEPNHKLALA